MFPKTNITNFLVQTKDKKST